MLTCLSSAFCDLTPSCILLFSHPQALGVTVLGRVLNSLPEDAKLSEIDALLASGRYDPRGLYDFLFMCLSGLAFYLAGYFGDSSCFLACSLPV